MKTPLWQALAAHVEKAPFSTHTPGHKSGHLIPAALKEAWGGIILPTPRLPSKKVWRNGRANVSAPAYNTS